MPIYGFECGSCGHRFDRLQRLADADPTVCPECGAEQIRRQLTAPQFRLAGGGWYETDFKKDGDKKRNLSEKSDAPAASADGGGKSEAKSDAKPDAPKSESKADSKPASAPAAPTAAPASTPAKPSP
jgi:putative FmdB family regulatory protein